ncbi:hypothetical protein A0128_14225 [Leptospira tipperaryensis]|uniref:Uncharacterized protein n=1 Tax=Leptospira tipperaryensis TaxID=2564040 RepID=A0A1D7UZA2_9LEPT|nr:hypothetical protein A0128_14225 [Leptospira tipperaryensis]
MEWKAFRGCDLESRDILFLKVDRRGSSYFFREGLLFRATEKRKIHCLPFHFKLIPSMKEK